MEKSTKYLFYIVGMLAVLLTVNLVTLAKFNNIKSTNAKMHTLSFSDMEKELSCMALNIYREAGYEPVEGRVAVAQVTLNRVNHPDFPNTVCGVVYQKNKVMEKVVCQFSWYCDHTHRTRPVNQQAYNESYEVAKKVMLEGFRLEKLNEALFYHADYVNPRWRLEKIGKIGTHIFYTTGQHHAKLAGI